MTIGLEISYLRTVATDVASGALPIRQALSSSVTWAVFFVIAALALDYFIIKQAFKSVTVKRTDADKIALVQQCLHLFSLRSAQKIIDEGFDSKDVFIRSKIQLLFLAGDIIGLQSFLSREGFKKGKNSEKDRAVLMRALLETPDLNQFSDMSKFFDAVLMLDFKRSEVVLFLIFASLLRVHSGPIPVKSKVTRANIQDIPFFNILERAWTEDVSREFMEHVESDSLSDIDEILKVGVASVLISIDGVSDKMTVEGAKSIFNFMSERRGIVSNQLLRHKPSGLIEYYAMIANNLQNFLKIKHGIEDEELRDAVQSAVEHASSEGRNTINFTKLNSLIEKNFGK